MFAEYLADPSIREIVRALDRNEILKREPGFEDILSRYNDLELLQLAHKKDRGPDENKIVTAARHIALARRGREFNFRKFYPAPSSS